MAGSYLADTNIVIAYLKPEPTVVQRIDVVGAIFVSSVVLGELYFGARKSDRVDANLARIAEFASKNTILPRDAETAEQYGMIREALRAAGRPIPENDVWIAATARQHGLTLATRDAHFAHVPALQIEAW